MNPGSSCELNETHRPWFRTPSCTVLLVVILVTLARIAYLKLDLLPLFGDEAQYWSWSLDPAFGYFSKPPMVAWAIAATTALAGHGEPAVKLASPLAHAVTSLLIFLIGSRLAGRRAGLWSCLVYLTMPAVSYSCGIISTDPLLLMFWSVALYGFIRAIGLCAENHRCTALPAVRSSTGWWLLTGLGLGCALLSKYTAVAFVLSAAFYLVTTSGRRALLRTPGPYLALAAALLIFAPNLLWNAEHGFVSIRHVGDNAHWTGNLFNPGRLAEFVGAQFGVFGPLPFACLLVMIVRWRRLAHDQALNVLLWFAAPLLGVICIQALISKAYANWAAPIYVAASVAFAIRLLDLGKQRWITATVIVHFVLGLALACYEPAVRGLELRVPARLDLLKRVRGWPDMGRQLARLRQENPDTLFLADDRLLMAQCLYYGAIAPTSAYSWNPQDRVRHHYDLVSDMNETIGRDFLFVSGMTGVVPLQECFDSVHELQPIEVPTHPDRTLRFSVYRLDRFRGYR